MARRILLAEDSLTIQKVFEIALAKSDFALTVADNGDEAVRLADEMSPDLVVADVSLPGKDGYEVSSDIKVSEKSRGCPVLILSGSVTPFDEKKFKGSRADGVLFKPFESQQLFDKIEELLRARAAAPAAEGAEAHAADLDEPATEGEEAGRGARRDEAEEHHPGGSEPWDFSDVLEEVDAEVGGKSRPAAPVPSRGEDLLPGGSNAPDARHEAFSLGEFDVSLDEVAEGLAPPAAAEPPAAPEPPPEAPAPPEPLAPNEPEAVFLAQHLEGNVLEDSPPAVTDLTPAIEDAFLSVEEIDEIEELEEIASLGSEAGVAPPAAPAAGPAETAVADAAATLVAGPAGAPAADVPGGPVPAPPVDAPAAAPLAPEVRDEFAGRAREIFEKVAAETVEKALWEFMDRFSREFAERLRESAEAVAWEVIPQTAEAIIREEIARIRAQAEKKTS